MSSVWRYLVERRQRRQSASDRGRHRAFLLRPPGERLEVWSLDDQQVDAMVVAPTGEDPQICRIAASCGVGVAGDERRDGDSFGDDHRIVVPDDLDGVDSGGFGVGHGGFLE